MNLRICRNRPEPIEFLRSSLVLLLIALVLPGASAATDCALKAVIRDSSDSNLTACEMHFVDLAQPDPNGGDWPGMGDYTLVRVDWELTGPGATHCLLKPDLPNEIGLCLRASLTLLNSYDCPGDWVQVVASLYFGATNSTCGSKPRTETVTHTFKLQCEGGCQNCNTPYPANPTVGTPFVQLSGTPGTVTPGSGTVVPPGGRRPPSPARFGQTQGWLQSLDFRFYLGRYDFEQDAGSLLLHADTPEAVTPTNFSLSSFRDKVSLVPAGNGYGLQVRSPEGLLRVVGDSVPFTLESYFTSDIEPDPADTNRFRPLPSASPISVWTVSRPDATRVSLSETGAQGRQLTYQFNAASNQWTLTHTNSTTVLSIAKLQDLATGMTNEVRSFQSADQPGVITQKTRRAYKMLGGFRMLMESQEGEGAAARTNRYSRYETEGANGYLLVKRADYPDGRWEMFQYDYVGRITNRFESYLDLAPPAGQSFPADYQSKWTSYDYSPIAPDDNTAYQGQMARTEIVRVPNEARNGWVVVSRTLRSAPSRYQVREQYCAEPNAGWNDAANLQSVRMRNDLTNATPEGLRFESHADGTATIYQQETNNTVVIVSQAKGQPDSWNSPSSILSGTVTRTFYGQLGRILSNSVSMIRNGQVLAAPIEKNAYSYSAEDRSGRDHYVIDLAGRRTDYYYACCGLENLVDPEGSVTSYSYDPSLGHLQTVSRSHPSAGTIITGYEYDAAGNVIRTTRQGAGTSTNLTLQGAAYNTAGQLLFETNALGVITAYGESYDSGTGETTRTTTNALGLAEQSTRFETYYRDGRLKRLSGTAVHGSLYEYGVDADGAYTKETRLAADGVTATSEWIKTSTDLLGRPYKIVYAPRSGIDSPTNPPCSQTWYNQKGQKTKEQDPDGVVTLFAYNSEGELEYTATDLNPLDTTVDTDGNYPINFGIDRITRTYRELDTKVVPNEQTYDVLRTVTQVWSETGPVTASISETALNGASPGFLRSWQVSAGVTNSTRVDYPGNGTRTETRTAPDGTRMVTEYRHGQIISVSRKDAAGSSYHWTTNAYDPHGRLWTSTDAHNGATTYGYDNADRLRAVTSPPPAPGQAAEVTATDYDNLGRVTKVTDPGGYEVNTEYSLTGETKRTYGNGTYPVDYTYDYAGRLRSMITWITYPAAGSTNTWNYDPYRGWLVSRDFPNPSNGAAPQTAGAAGPLYAYTPGGRLWTRSWLRTGTDGQRIVTTNLYGFSDSILTNHHADLVQVLYSANSLISTPALTYSYDRRGRRTQVLHDGMTNTLAYNDANQLLSEAHSGGLLGGFGLTNVYDNYLRRISASLNTQPSTLNFGFAYDPYIGSRLVRATNGASVASYAYVNNSLLLSQWNISEGSVNRLTVNRYYDALNRLTNITCGSLSSAYRVGPGDLRTALTNADGSFWVYGYGPAKQLISARKKWGDNTPVAGQQFEYNYDDIGNRITAASGGDAAGSNLRQQQYAANRLNQYDSRSFLGYVSFMGTAHPTATVSLWAGSGLYATTTRKSNGYYWGELLFDNSSAPVYPIVSNIAVLNNPPGPDPVAMETGRVFVARSPEVFRYDADGNLTNDGRWVFTWDNENRLVKVESLTNAPAGSKRRLEFAYDHQGRRIWKKVTDLDTGATLSQTKFLYDGWDLVAELNATNNALVRSYTWGLDLSGSLQGAGGVGGLLKITYYGTQTTNAFVAYDGNGNVLALVNSADGTLIAQYEYGPFGEVIRATGPMARVNPFRFSTKYQDDETDLLYYGYRYYSASAGRWLNPDPLCNRPIVPVNDLVFRELRYLFARNDGIGWIDPLGLWEGTFVVSHYNVTLQGGEARRRNIPDGAKVPGFSVRYVPEKKRCSCPKDKIVIVQVISHNSNAVPGKDPQVDSSDSGPLPGAYSGSRNGNLQIFDAPWNRWLRETTYTIEDCALCRDGTKNPETILGCVKFAWTKDGHQLSPEGAIPATGPSQTWNDGVARWTAIHAGGN